MPPAPEQVSTKVVFAVSAPVDCVPVSALVPVQPPEAVHAVALLDDQDRVEEAPLATVLGFALSVTVAVCLGVTVTLTDCAALPPAPLQLNV